MEDFAAGAQRRLYIHHSLNIGTLVEADRLKEMPLVLRFGVE